MNIAAYCRVSTDKADQLDSLAAQKQFFVQYAARHGHDLVGLYADEGLSGTKTRCRRQFLQMMADAQTGAFQMLVVKDISRLARNTVDLLQSVRRLRQLGVETVFLTADMTSLGGSEFILTVFGALAQEESANLSKRVKFGKRLNAEKGRVPNLVFGYDKLDCFHMAVNPQEAEILRQMARRYLEDGWGAGRIAAALNEQGVRTKRGCLWTQSAVCRVLTNPLYTGRIINGKQEVTDFLTSQRADVDAAHWLVALRPEMQILSEEIHRRLCAEMERRAQRFCCQHTRQSSRYPLSTLIRCGECGRSFRRISRTYRTTHVRWSCSRRNSGGGCPNAVTVEEDALLRALDDYLLALLPQDPRMLERALRRAMEASSCAASPPAEAAALRRELEQLESRRGRYLELFAADLLSRRELEEKLQFCRSRQQTLQLALERCEAPESEEEHVRSCIARALEKPESWLTVRRLNHTQLARLIQSVTVTCDGRVRVAFCL